MNILIYFGDQLCPTAGGTERVACLLADYFESKGHNLTYLACRRVDLPNAVESEFLPNKIEAPTPANIRAVKEIIEKHKIDIILNEGGFGEVSRLFSHEHIPSEIKIISHLHFDPLRGKRGFYQSLNLPLSLTRQGARNLFEWIKSPYHRYKLIKTLRARFGYIAKYSDKVITLCPRHSSLMKSMVETQYAHKIHSLTNPLTFITNKVDYSKKCNEILYVGRLEYSQKRVDRILKAWQRIYRKHPDWKLTIVGDGPYRKTLESLCVELGLERIQFIGQKQSKPFYERAKMLLLTSNNEGTPMVIQEAMSYGVVPIVMNSFSAASDMIKDGYNGILTKAFSIGKMANTVTKLIHDPKYWEQLSINAHQTIIEMDNSRLLSQWDEILK